LKTFEKSLSFANVLHTGYNLLTDENNHTGLWRQLS